jgi:hypothetical protein
VAADVPAFVTKEDASEAQHEEARIYGGQNLGGGMAAQMQVSELRGLLLCATGCGADYLEERGRQACPRAAWNLICRRAE